MQNSAFDKIPVYVVADNVLSPIGNTTAENFANLKQGISGVKECHDPAKSARPFFASLFNKDRFSDGGITKFEQLLIASVSDALQNTVVNVKAADTVLIISTTKGNISLLETGPYNDDLKKRVALSTSAKLVARHFGFVNEPVIISNACISGAMGIITAMRLLRAGLYTNAVIAGADVISQFVLSGFESFHALSEGPCRPFDKDRTGLNLGEGAGTIILSADKKYSPNIQVMGGAVSNDANHISGPSRTGKELGYAIAGALKDAEIDANDISFISAHGTATSYNDEMEASAIAMSGLQDAPVNSLKGYYGHTLGAAGLIESIISLQSLRENTVLPTPGFQKIGVTAPINVCFDTIHKPLNTFLKTASGFGGCNAAVVFGK